MPGQQRIGQMHERVSRHRPDESYYIYVPANHDRATASRLLVTIHGQSRGALTYAERFIAFADTYGYLLLAPRFPQSVRYQELGIGGERADLRLLELVDEVGTEYAVETDTFDLFGYSGGAQFAHRFLYVQPARLRSVVVGAPGTVTLPNEQLRWPAGVRGLGKSAGIRFNLEEIRQRRVMLIVGQDDLTLDGFNQSEWAMRTGTSRLGRARFLHAAWLVAGIGHTYIEVPRTGHGLEDAVVAEACRFFADGL